MTCAQGQAIVIYQAAFGRQDNHTCADGRDVEQVNQTCPTRDTVVAKIRRTCEGRQDCTVSVYTDALGDPCPGIYKYLQIEYACRGNFTHKKNVTCFLGS